MSINEIRHARGCECSACQPVLIKHPQIRDTKFDTLRWTFKLHSISLVKQVWYAHYTMQHKSDGQVYDGQTTLEQWNSWILDAPDNRPG